MYNPYGSPYALPIPGSARPTALATAPNVSYPDVSSGGVFALANATANFALRLTGEHMHAECDSTLLQQPGGRPCAGHVIDIAASDASCLALWVVRGCRQAAVDHRSDESAALRILGRLPMLAGSINLPGNKTQNYTFSMDSDDDSLLYMDGKQVVSDTGGCTLVLVAPRLRFSSSRGGPGGPNLL